MNNFPTPSTYRDGWTDATRPHNLVGMMDIGGGIMGSFCWSSITQSWSPYQPPAVQVQPASPLTIMSIPGVIKYHATSQQAFLSPSVSNVTMPSASQRQPVSFPPLLTVPTAL